MEKLRELVDLVKESPQRPPKTAMTFPQVRDVLDYIQAFHQRLSDFYHQLSDEAEKSRVIVVGAQHHPLSAVYI